MTLTSLDTVDRIILKALQDDALTPHSVIAKAAARSESVISRRISQLRARGVIRAIRADVDPEALGLEMVVFTLVSLKQHGDSSTATFEAFLDGIPNIVEWCSTGGSWDYLLKFLVEDKKKHDELHFQLLNMPQISRLRGMHVIGNPHTKLLPVNVSASSGSREAGEAD